MLHVSNAELPELEFTMTMTRVWLAPALLLLALFGSGAYGAAGPVVRVRSQERPHLSHARLV